jgi:uncharacterized membrane protein YfcA
MTPVFLVLGLAAGALTTLAGQGGGLVLLLACTTILPPHDALALTAPALLLGNLHRAILLRAHVDRPIGFTLIAGAVPGSVVGGMLVGAVPSSALRVLLVVLTMVAIAKALGLLRIRVPRPAILPAGFLVGAMTSTSGGAGVLLAPILLSAGLTGRTFVATASTAAAATHIGRVVGYATHGLFSRSLIAPTVMVTVAIFAGNAIGERLRVFLTERRAQLVEYGTLIVCVVLSVAGFG